MMNQTIKNKLRILPEQPGCYLMKNKQGKIIYVGKAKVLKNRVRSYFTGTHDGKTLKLVEEIADFDYIVTTTNTEALILEMNLIKKNHPKYNVMLMDDKTYPYIKITKERHPRLIITRNLAEDGGRYFGPYPNVQAALEIKKLLEHLYPLRKCPLSAERPCLHYHLGLCIGPCAREVSEAEYQQSIDGIVRFFKGGYKVLKKELTMKMETAVQELDFELAAKLRNQTSQIETVMEKQKMLTTDGAERDVFGYAVSNGWICVQVFFIREGKMSDRNVSIFPIMQEHETEFLCYLQKYYSSPQQSKPKEILIPIISKKDLSIIQGDVKAIQPMRGQKRQLVDLACKNASIALKDKLHLKSSN